MKTQQTQAIRFCEKHLATSWVTSVEDLYVDLRTIVVNLGASFGGTAWEFDLAGVYRSEAANFDNRTLVFRAMPGPANTIVPNPAAPLPQMNRTEAMP